MFHDAFGAQLAKAPTRWIEPPWKAILSNKGILPLLWEMFPNHPSLRSEKCHKRNCLTLAYPPFGAHRKGWRLSLAEDIDSSLEQAF
jgi:hypothetical protein